MSNALIPPADKTLLETLLLPAMIYAAIGLVVSLFVHLMSIAGFRLGGMLLFSALFIGIFPMWFVVIRVLVRKFGTSNKSATWQAVLSGCPAWMRWMTVGFFAYGIVNFVIAAANHVPMEWSGTAAPPAEVWRSASGHWMVFYSAGLGVLTSAYRQGISPRKCSAGHVAGLADDFCPVCGGRVGRP